MANDITYGDASRQGILRGINSLANAVKVTLGPRGRNVILEQRAGSPTITKDGASVASVITLPNALENMGAQMVKEVASKTSDVAGDGTTTAAVLTQAMYREGARNATGGANPQAMRRGIEKAVAAIAAELTRMSKPVSGTMIAQVGTISANNDPAIGGIIADAMEQVGKDGVITVEEGKTLDTSFALVHGMRFDRGYLSAYFVTDAERMEAVLDDPLILICETKVALKGLVAALEIAATADRPLLIVAEDLDADALATAVVNKLRGTVRVAAVKAPGYGDARKALLEDLAILTGGRAVTQDLGMRLETVTIADLGQAKKITIDQHTTTIIEGAGDASSIAGRVKQLRVQATDSASDYDREKLQERLAKLVGGVAVITVGAATDTEMKEKKTRIEDALHATEAAVEEGIVAGGGVALLRAAAVLRMLQLDANEQVGVTITARAIEEPMRWIANNAGYEGAVVVERTRQLSGDEGFNAQTERYENLIEAGVIDPTKVVRSALQNAASVVGLLLTMEAVVSAAA